MGKDLDKIVTLIPFIVALCGFVYSLVMFLISRIKAKKNGKEATDANATLDLQEKARECIAQAEKLYNYKVNGQGQGAQKKENVISKLRLYAVEKGYNVDELTLSKMVDDFVAFMNTNKQNK